MSAGQAAGGYEAEEATVASAGEPQQQSGSRQLAAGEGAPSPEDLDARESNFAGPRKPMGPGQDHVAPSEPTDAPAPDET